MFLHYDNVRMGQENLKEPSESWYVGPFVEARRVVTPKGKQSAPTDHLPVDAKVYIRNDLI